VSLAYKFLNLSNRIAKLTLGLLLVGVTLSPAEAKTRVSHDEIARLQIKNIVDPNESLQSIAQAIQRLEPSDNVDLQLRLLILFGNNLIDNGLFEIADRFIPSAIFLAQTHNKTIALAHLKALKIATLTDSNEINNALSTSVRSLFFQMRQDIDLAQVAQSMLGLARITNELRKSDLTIELISHIKRIYQENPALADLEPHYWQLYGSVLHHTGDTEAALEAQRRALDYAISKGQALNSSTHHYYLAALYFAKQDWPQAKIHYIESYLISKRLDDLIGMASGARLLAEVYRKSNLAVDNIEALNWAKIALPLQQKLGYQSAITSLHINIGQLKLQSQLLAEAKQQYDIVKDSPFAVDASNLKEFLKFGADLAAAEGNFNLAYQRYVKFNETTELQANKSAKGRLTSLRSLLAYSEAERSTQTKQSLEIELAQRTKNDRLQMAVAILGVALFAGMSAAAIYFRRSSDRYKNLSENDELTGAHSRRYLFEAGEEILKNEQRISRHLTTAILLDVDHFKRVNDRWGHLVGDQVLKHCVAQIRQVTRSSDAIVARYGGEEFCVLIPNIDQLEARAVAERIRLQMANNPFIHKDASIAFTVSIGMAQPDLGSITTTLTQLIKVADERLYKAKNLGRNRVVFDDETTAA
jgi:diguanylate cyclase (GGDEF)-like protein